jgi:hypothetical protein
MATKSPALSRKNDCPKVINCSIPRNKGMFHLNVELKFNIFNNRLVCYREDGINARYVCDKKTGRYLICKTKFELPNNGSDIIAQGRIIPDKMNNHNGLWLISYPLDHEKIIKILTGIEIYERLHDDCSFLNHYSHFTILDGMGQHLGTLEDILFSAGRAQQTVLFN